MEISKQFGKRLAQELGVPVFLYGYASDRDYRKTMPQVLVLCFLLLLHGCVCTHDCVYAKLMRSSRPQAKFCFKPDLNCLLIDFFDPISAARFTHRDNTLRIRTQNLILSSNLIKNMSNFIENGRKRLDFQLNSTLSIEFDHF